MNLRLGPWRFVWPTQHQTAPSPGQPSPPLLRPETAEELVTRGAQLVENEQLDSAEECYRRAIALQADYAEAHFKLGNLRLKTKQLNAAEACYEQALRCDPDFVKAHYNLGNTLKAQGRAAEAKQRYRRALEVDPTYTVAACNLGVALADEGQFEEAEACYRQVLKLVPDDVITLNNLGVALKGRGLFVEAEQSCRLALQRDPNYASAHNTLGAALKEQGRFVEAEGAYRKALTLRPVFPEALNNLGIALRAQQRQDEAEECCRNALIINPEYLNAYLSLGNILADQGRYRELEDLFRKVLTLNPSSAEAHNRLAGGLINQGKVGEALASFRKALELKPEYTQAHSNLLFTLNYRSELSPLDLLSEAQRYGQSITNKIGAPLFSRSLPLHPKRLRVGMVSGDLLTHPVGFFLESILRHINSGRVELIAYPTQHLTDETSTRLQGYMSAWKPITSLSDQAAAQLISDDEIHVLLDLSGHTSHNRLPVFAWQPAPVQATWLGYFATTGVIEMDYILADATGVPDENRNQFTESVYYLPDTRLCFTAPRTDVPVTASPVSINGYLTFGCFQNLAKVNDGVLQRWGEILTRRPSARLHVQSPQLDTSEARKAFLERLRHHGIAAERITLQGMLERTAYLAVHGKIDVILDTFPYPGGTTTCEALWMGVPTLTLAGNTMIERQGASLLVAAGLPDWVACSQDDYVEKAITLTEDLSHLAELRKSLRQQVLESPLFDASRFARNLENALWDMWSTHARDSD